MILNRYFVSGNLFFSSLFKLILNKDDFFTFSSCFSILNVIRKCYIFTMNDFFSLQLDLLEQKLKTDFAKGLSNKDAQQKLILEGSNNLKETVVSSWFQKLRQQFQDIFVYFLLGSATLTFILGIITYQKETIFESILILVIILINGFLGFFYDNQKEKSLVLIKQKTITYVKVLRDNSWQLVPKEKLVRGDIVLVETGDYVPADLRLLQVNYCRINESLLTGEQEPVVKNPDIIPEKWDLLNAPHVAFKDTIVLYGNAKGVVVATGMQTQVGEINQWLQQSPKIKTTLEKNINKLVRFLSWVIIILIGSYFSLNLIQYYWEYHQIPLAFIQKNFLSSIALAIAIIPEGLLALITIILALGMKKLSHQKTIVKKLYTLEQLGTISVICTDKTGTLTHNKMNIKKLYTFPQSINIDKEHSLSLSPYMNKLIAYGFLCHSITITSNYHKLNASSKTKSTLFDPIDKAFGDLIYWANLDADLLTKNHPKIKEFPFDSYYKLMITMHQNSKGQNYFILKGAAEIILNLATSIADNQTIMPKTKIIQLQIEKICEKMAIQEGYKILGVAYTSYLSEKININVSMKEILNQIKTQIIFLGLVGMEDPIREDILPTITKCQKAFITPIMITGDHLQTAIHIAHKLNILHHNKDLAITGNTLDTWNEDKLLQKLYLIKVYARVNPEHKLRIIQAWQTKGHIVAMIGDGMNDAPSIKKADVGIAMGMTGTEVTKKAADIILTNDNFITIQEAIMEGRNILANIQKSILFLLSCNIGEIIIILLNTLLRYWLFHPSFMILNTFQILWVNLVTDSLLVIALSMEKPEKDLMQKKPQHMQNTFLNYKLISKILFEGFMIAGLTLTAAWIGYKKYNQNDESGQTFAFIVLTGTQLIHVFNLRHLTFSLFSLKSNSYLKKCFFLCLLLQILIVVIPFFKDKFHLATLNYIDVLIITSFSLAPLILVEIVKFFFFRNKNTYLK